MVGYRLSLGQVRWGTFPQGQVGSCMPLLLTSSGDHWRPVQTCSGRVPPQEWLLVVTTETEARVLPVARGRGQVGGWGCLGESGDMGGVTTCTHVHAHAHKRMYRNCKWPPTWRHPCLSCLSCLRCMCMHVCMHVHVCVHGTPPYTPIPTSPASTHPPPPRGDSWNWSKFNNT